MSHSRGGWNDARPGNGRGSRTSGNVTGLPARPPPIVSKFLERVGDICCSFLSDCANLYSRSSGLPFRAYGVAHFCQRWFSILSLTRIVRASPGTARVEPLAVLFQSARSLCQNWSHDGGNLAFVPRLHFPSTVGFAFEKKHLTGALGRRWVHVVPSWCTRNLPGTLPALMPRAQALVACRL